MNQIRHVSRMSWRILLIALLIAALSLNALAADSALEAQNYIHTGGSSTSLAAAAYDGEALPEIAPQLDANPKDPSISCLSAIVVDMNNGNIVYDYNSKRSCFPASTTKVMTAYLCLKYGNLNDYVTVKKEILSDVIPDATTLGLVGGERIQVRSLLQSMLMISSCDSANVIAQYISGSIPEFAALMNREAAALGCTGTHFASAHGLPNTSHYTTANDMALIARAAMTYPEFRQIVRSHSVIMVATSLHGARQLVNINDFLPESGAPYAYAYATGIKTGTTTAAGYCLVSSAEKDGVPLIGVVFGSTTREGRYYSSRNLFDWAFQNYHPGENTFPFVDVPRDAWYYDTIRAAYEAELVNGMSATVFSPKSNVTRGQFVTILYRMAGSPGVTGKPPFQDLTQNWYLNAVNWAWKNEVVYGTSATAFSPGKDITRQDLTTILYRYAGSPKVTGNMLSGFTDAAAISGYAHNAVEWAVENHIMYGSNNQIRPRDTATRAEACALLMRLRDYLG